MKKDLICPNCGYLGFESKAVWGDSSQLKCDNCGEWALYARWEKAKTWQEYRAEVSRLTALCDGYRGERDALKAKCEDRRNMLEDVVNELDLSDGMIEQHGPLGTAPATLVRLILEQKDMEIAMLKAGMVPIGAESALTRARAEGMEEACGIISGILAEVHGYGVTRALTRAFDTIRARANKGDSTEACRLAEQAEKGE